jgi:hypothetical protein
MIDFNKLNLGDDHQISKKQEIQNLLDSLGLTVADTPEARREQERFQMHENISCSIMMVGLIVIFAIGLFCEMLSLCGLVSDTPMVISVITGSVIFAVGAMWCSITVGGGVSDW